MSGDDAKRILRQLGWFDDEAHLLTARFTEAQWTVFQHAHLMAMSRSDAPSLEEFLAELAKDFIEKQNKKATSGIAVPDAAMV